MSARTLQINFVSTCIRRCIVKRALANYVTTSFLYKVIEKCTSMWLFILFIKCAAHKLYLLKTKLKQKVIHLQQSFIVFLFSSRKDGVGIYCGDEWQIGCSCISDFPLLQVHSIYRVCVYAMFKTFTTSK